MGAKFGKATKEAAFCLTLDVKTDTEIGKQLLYNIFKTLLRGKEFTE